MSRQLTSASTPKCTKPAMLQIPSLCRNYLFFLSLISPTIALEQDMQYDIVNVQGHEKRPLLEIRPLLYSVLWLRPRLWSGCVLAARVLFVCDRNNRAAPAVRRAKPIPLIPHR